MGKYTAAVPDQLVLPARVLQTRGQQQAWQLLGRPLPAPVPVGLVIDTASKRSTLVPGVISHLDPASQGRVRVETSLAALEATLFWVRLEFPGTSLAPIPELAVARVTMPVSLRSFHGVIGRDLLRQQKSLFFEGHCGRFTLRDVPGGLFGWLGR